MKKKMLRIAFSVAALLMFVTACTAAAPANTEGADQVPGTGATAEGTSPVVETLGAAVECAGVDTQLMIAAGQTLYTENCASCHGEQGEGVGDFPALAGNQVVTTADVQQLIQGYFAVDAHPKEMMPEDFAAMFTYMRGSFGNTADAVCPVDITLPVMQ